MESLEHLSVLQARDNRPYGNTQSGYKLRHNDDDDVTCRIK